MDKLSDTIELDIEMLMRRYITAIAAVPPTNWNEDDAELIKQISISGAIDVAAAIQEAHEQWPALRRVPEQTEQTEQPKRRQFRDAPSRTGETLPEFGMPDESIIPVSRNVLTFRKP